METALIIIGTVIATIVVIAIIGAILEKPGDKKKEISTNKSTDSDDGLGITDIIELKAVHDYLDDEEEDESCDDDDD